MYNPLQIAGTNQVSTPDRQRISKKSNKVNAKFFNANGHVQSSIYKEAEAADEGFRLTKLKKGAGIVEDDTLKQQHVTTAIGYWKTYILTKLANKGVTIQVG